MDSLSKCKRNRKQKKGKSFIRLEDWEMQKLEKQRQMFKPRNWLDLPSDLMATILMRLSVVDVIGTAQKVCSSWRQICKDPLMWKSIYMNDDIFYCQKVTFEKVARIAMDRSCGQLTEISIEHFASYELLEYIADRSPQLTSLRLARCNLSGLSEAVLKLPRLTYIDLSLSSCYQFRRVIEDIGHCCPLLKTFIHNDTEIDYGYHKDENDFVREEERSEWWFSDSNEEAFAIAANMPGIHHLMLVGNRLSNAGLRAILDGCSHLVSLDLRCCQNIYLAGDLGKRCRDQIKHLRGPGDSISDYPYTYKEDESRYWTLGRYYDHLYGLVDDVSVHDMFDYEDDDDDDEDEYGYLYDEYL